MKKQLGSFAFYLVYPFFWVISNLPLPLLYILSDGLSFLAYRVFKYRLKVVRKNLLASFPDKTDEERNAIEKRFYRHLVDSLLEPLILLSCSEKKIFKHIKLTNVEVINEFYKQNRNIIVTTGHYGNWEWPGAFAKLMFHKVLALYKPLNNPRFEKLFYKLRSKFSGIPVPMADTLRFVNQYINAKIPFALYMVADQRPLKQHAKMWLTFMNQATPILPGSSKIGRKYNMPIFFLYIRKIKRGCYECENILISDNPSELSENELLRRYFEILEANIRENPDLYLWSHNRWRFNRQEIEKDFPITFIDQA